MKRLSLIDIIVCIGTIFLVVVTLAPAVARLQRTPEDARCQSNMRRWGEALALYTNDNDRRYPTNRFLPAMGLTAHAFLSPKQYDANGNPVRFVNSINWVEALYPYLITEAKKTERDWESFLRCPKASNATFPQTSRTARVTYAFNYNLLEFSPALVRDAAKTMMIREMDRLVESACRPTNNSAKYPSLAPMSPFLANTDSMIRNVTINNNLHAQGSHILLADGHVAYFGTEYFPSQLSPASQFDPETGQWWNWVNTDPALDKTIAITP